jgi:hypothetical protein
MNTEPDDIESIRPAFEAWVSRPPYYGELDRWPDGKDGEHCMGKYMAVGVELAWQSWQEAALGEAISRSAPKPLSYEIICTRCGLREERGEKPEADF